MTQSSFNNAPIITWEPHILPEHEQAGSEPTHIKIEDEAELIPMVDIQNELLSDKTVKQEITPEEEKAL